MAFELALAVEERDIDEIGHVNIVAYLRCVQEAATAHWNATAPAEDRARLLRVVLRHERPVSVSDAVRRPGAGAICG